VLISALTVMSIEQDLVKGKDTMVPLVDFQEKKRTGWRELRISSSGVVQYISNTCFYKFFNMSSNTSSSR
jgi:hypothetical protein